jgi:ankyrin repeat protein
MIVSEKGHLAVVDRLIASGPDVNRHLALDGSTPLCTSARKGHADVVGRLVVAGADVNQPRTDTNRAARLRVASWYGHVRVVERLLAAGADINRAGTVDGITPVYIAAQKGFLEIVELLTAAPGRQVQVELC